MKIVVIGGSGLIGTKLVKLLRERGHEALAASPSSGVNTITGEGLAEALAGAQVVVDLANAPSWEDNAVLEFFLPGTFGSSCCGQASSGPGGIRPTKPDRALRAARRRHRVRANASETKPAKLLGVFVVDADETELTIPFGN